MPTPLEKTCVVCGRRITWRRKWARNWDEIRFCSAACRRQGLRPIDHDLETAILRLLDQRRAGATICPSDAARELRPDDWRDLMESSRQAARRLVAAGRVVITQGGRVVDPSTARGPVRIRRS